MTEPERPSAGTLLGLRLAAGALIAFGVLALMATFAIRQPGGYSPIGPRIFPLAVSLGLLVFGALFLVRATIRPDRELVERAAEEDRATHWPIPGWLGLALVAYALTLQPLGYVVATALFVPASSRILGSRSWVRDVVVGAAMALVLYLGFTRFLGVR
ncbi:MAG: tripartite tricarboxylate transporter TctB family protein, partial [Acidimicrobiia bacterium]